MLLLETRRDRFLSNVVFEQAIMYFRTAAVLVMCVAVPCRAADPIAKSYGPSAPNDNNYPQYNNNNYEMFRPLAVFTERPVNVADYVLVPVVQVSASDLRMIYRPQIDSVSKTEPIVMCKSSSTKSFVSIVRQSLFSVVETHRQIDITARGRFSFVIYILKIAYI